MTLPNTYWLFNNTSNSGENTGNSSGGAGGSSSNWVVIDLVNDKIMFLDDQQMDGDPDTTEKYRIILPTSGSIEAPKTFIDDDSEDLYDQVPLAGTTNGEQDGGNTRYVFAIYFDGATAGIPKIEAWDDSDHDSVIKTFLGGNGVDTESPTDSLFSAIATTNAVPGSATWAGTPLAGATSRIDLDTAPLAGAQNCYFNLKMVVPYDFSPGDDTDIVFSLRFLYS
jgi:hypothetical protein